jgi:transposase
VSLTVIHACRFALDPTPRQVSALLRHTGAARVTFNWGLAQVKVNSRQREAERSYGVVADEETPPFDWSMYSMRKAWNGAQAEVAPWRTECSKEAYSTGLGQLARALRNWSDAKLGKCPGLRSGFRRVKSKRPTTPSVQFTTGAIWLEYDRRHLTWPVRGTLRTDEPTRKHYDTARRTRGRLSRSVSRKQGPDRRTPAQLSKRCQRANDRRNKVHRYGTVVVENLNVSRMLGNRRLARVVAGAGFAEVPRQLSCTTQCKVERHVAGSGSETRNGRRADRKTSLRGAGGATSRKGEETSTPHRFPEQSGHTGTSSQQWADRRDSLVSR